MATFILGVALALMVVVDVATNGIVDVIVHVFVDIVVHRQTGSLCACGIFQGFQRKSFGLFACHLTGLVSAVRFAVPGRFALLCKRAQYVSATDLHVADDDRAWEEADEPKPPQGRADVRQIVAYEGNHDEVRHDACGDGDPRYRALDSRGLEQPALVLWEQLQPIAEQSKVPELIRSGVEAHRD